MVMANATAVMEVVNEQITPMDQELIMLKPVEYVVVVDVVLFAEVLGIDNVIVSVAS